MFYPKNNSAELDKKLFQNPTSEYRATPFWAWNSKLDQEELNSQIDVFKQMGFGGFHMHVRQGLETEYMSSDFLSAISACVEKARKEDMLAYLYDEDRWPSGVAGGKVTKTLEYRQKYITMSESERQETAENEWEAAKTGKPFFLAAFDIEFDENGKMLSFAQIERTAQAKHKKKYFFLEQRAGGEPRYNYQSYVDTMSEQATQKFLEITHEKFKNAVGKDFGGVVPSIFTDEPQVAGNAAPRSAFDAREIRYSWTTDFQKTYCDTYGEDLVKDLPLLFFHTDDIRAYEVRYNYFTHVSQRFCTAYMDKIGDWCEKNGIALTGHVLGEDALYETILNNADIMRTYKNMQIPGIDILCDDVVFNTPIQCRSVVRQYGREAMLSELYGVTGWDFDFRGHKYQGDWQACLGVTIRVPHLAWLSMKGEGKRDYPAAISYQSPWYTEYKYLEDHYARINTAMTRGLPKVDVAVIHPIDTYKILYASLSETKLIRTEIETNFSETTKWLLSEGFEFDYVSEALLPELCKKGEYPLQVGKMQYKVLIVSDCITLRPHTIKILNEFKKHGGKVIVKGRTPQLCCGKPSALAQSVCENATVIPHSQYELVHALSEYRSVDIKDENGVRTADIMCSTRMDGENKWLFLAHMNKPELPHLIHRQELAITVKGRYIPYIYDTLSGEIFAADYKTDETKTTVYYTLYNLDTLLIKFEPSDKNQERISKKLNREWLELDLPQRVDYRLSEKNVLVLDIAEYAVDGGDFQKAEEIMRIDSIVRKQLNLQSRRTKFVQPWAISGTTEDHVLKLKFTVHSEIDCAGALLALEHPETTQIAFNDVIVQHGEYGYYVDKDIKTVKLPLIRKGENVIVLTMPFGLRTDVEACYLVGDFGTSYFGRCTALTQKPEQIAFGDVGRQGFAFYGGNIIYQTELDIEEDCDLEITVSHYRGAIVGVSLDGEDKGRIAFQPFKLCVNGVKKGKHNLEFTLFGTRYNTFTALHNLNADKRRNYIGPDYWRTENEAWSYEYNTRAMGILKAPVIKIHYNAHEG